MLPAMQILVSIGTVGASPQIGEILTLVTFFLTVLSCPYLFSRSYAQVEPLDRFSPFMAQTTFPRNDGPFEVRTMGYHIWEKYAPKTPQKWA